MNDSLKQKLYDLVKERGYLSYGDMCQFCAEWEYKVETATRRLRGLCADKNEQGIKQVPQIAPVMKKGKRTGNDYIAAWEWIGKGKIVMTNIDAQQSLATQNPEYKKHIEEVMRTTINGISVEVFAGKKETKEKQKEGNLWGT